MGMPEEDAAVKTVDMKARKPDYEIVMQNIVFTGATSLRAAYILC
jgi:hypothetical protein